MRLIVFGSFLLASSYLGCSRAPREMFPARSHATPDQIAIGDDVRLAMWTKGTGGDTLVLVNGGPGASHESIDRLASIAPAGMRVVLYDQRGVGESTAPHDDARFTLDDYVRDLESVRRAAGAPRIHLLGHSFGGLVAMAYAASHGEHVASLTLVAPKAPDAEEDAAANEALERRVTALAAAGKISAPPPSAGDDCRAQSAAFVPALFADPSFSAPREDMARTACSAHVMQATGARLTAYDLRGALAHLVVPTLVVMGEGDPFGDALGQASVRALAASRPDYVRLPACGHFPWLECDAAFRPRVQAFLTAAIGR